MQIAEIIEGSGGKCEDRLRVFDAPVGLVLVVADGAGGIGGGAEAAEAAVRIARQGAFTLSTPDACSKLLYNIDTEISKLSSGGETTCVVAVVSLTEIYGASVGDSIAWLILDGGIVNLTEYQMRKPFLGSGTAHPVSFSRTRSPAKLLLASDGLVKYATAERISQCVLQTDVNTAARDLIEMVRYPSGKLPDDVAVILADHKT